jgi:hypothetical protein
VQGTTHDIPELPEVVLGEKKLPDTGGGFWRWSVSTGLPPSTAFILRLPGPRAYWYSWRGVHGVLLFNAGLATWLPVGQPASDVAALKPPSPLIDSMPLPKCPVDLNDRAFSPQSAPATSVGRPTWQGLLLPLVVAPVPFKNPHLVKAPSRSNRRVERFCLIISLAPWLRWSVMFIAAHGVAFMRRRARPYLRWTVPLVTTSVFSGLKPSFVVAIVTSPFGSTEPLDG